MGEKDITEKILADYNDVFADIMNGLLFAGEQRILPEALENTSIHSHQSVVEKNMPFSVIGYDGTAYRSQLLEERKKDSSGGNNRIILWNGQTLEQQEKY